MELWLKKLEQEQEHADVLIDNTVDSLSTTIYCRHLHVFSLKVSQRLIQVVCFKLITTQIPAEHLKRFWELCVESCC